MNADRKSLFDFASDWLTMLGERLRSVMTLPAADATGRGESDRSTDPDFDGWVANDPMVTLNPASRYGDDATGFLAGSELENPELGRTED
jgi:hypothetical protein